MSRTDEHLPELDVIVLDGDGHGPSIMRRPGRSRRPSRRRPSRRRSRTAGRRRRAGRFDRALTATMLVVLAAVVAGLVTSGGGGGPAPLGAARAEAPGRVEVRAKPIVARRFVDRPCDTQVAAPTRCAWFEVPERRDIADARTIRLWVAVVSPVGAVDGAPPSAATISLPGGPGAAASTPWVSGAAAPPATTTVVVDTRGAGRSEPRLDCEATARFAPGASWEIRTLALRSEALACQQRLLSAGVDPEGYDLVESARDLVELRAALGIESWDVRGTSDGTSLAIELAAQDPAGVRSLVLDSPVAEDTPASLVAAADDALTRIEARCVTDAACAALGSFGTNLDQAAARLDAAPSVVVLPDGTSFLVDGQVLRYGVAVLMGEQTMADRLPAAVAATVDGDLALIELVASRLVATTADGPDGVAWGLQQILRCAGRPEPTDADRRALLDGADEWAVLLATWAWPVCADWHLTVAEPTVGASSSDLGVLVLVGELDPTSARAEATALAVRFPRTTVVGIAGAGHVVADSSPCAASIVAAFRAEPTATPDLSCAGPAPTGASLDRGFPLALNPIGP